MSIQSEVKAKKILILTTISRTINAFLIPHIVDLVRNGYSVEIACNDVNQVDKILKDLNLRNYELPLSRNPFSLKNINALKKLNTILKNNQYSIIHTHTPIISAIVRLLAKRLKLSNIYYTAHGFHFYRGAPLKNWLIFYTIEKYLSRYTDTLITINKEDFELAKKKFHSRRVLYIPGIGIDFTKFNNLNEIDSNIIGEIGICNSNLNIFSIGEINKNKNHLVILKAIRKLNNDKIHYYIVGEGKNKVRLQKVIKKYRINKQVHFLGFRKDIPNILQSADLFAFPSKREGLGLAAIEAIISNVPLITSNIHGINDYSIDNVTSYKCNPNDYKCFAYHISKYLDDRSIKSRLITWKESNIQKYSINNVIDIMRDIYINSQCKNDDKRGKI